MVCVFHAKQTDSTSNGNHLRNIIGKSIRSVFIHSFNISCTYTMDNNYSRNYLLEFTIHHHKVSNIVSIAGHVMFQAAFLCIVLSELMNQLYRRRVLTRKISNITGWFVYLCLINMVALSRMYFGCHFFHQCLLGAILGYFIARYTIRNSDVMDKVYSYNKMRMLAIGTIIAVTAACVFHGQKLFGRDPLWSIKIVSTCTDWSLCTI